MNDVEAGKSSVTITGEFSFAARAWLDDQDCVDSVTDNDLLKREDGKVTDPEELKPQTPAYVNANSNLCIMARAHTEDDPISIPEVTYMVKTTYEEGTTDAAFEPEDGGPHELGMIERDGTTVRFPYLTTREGYVQRIRIVSRAPDGATYTMTFADNADATAMAVGSLDKGRNTLEVSDMVMINDGGTTTSGELVIEAPPGMIDIASTLNTPGSTDTVLHSAE